MSVDKVINNAVSQLPDELQKVFNSYWQEFQPNKAVFNSNREGLETVAKVWATSDFVARSCLRDPEMLQDLIVSGDLFTAYPPQVLRQQIDQQLSAVSDEEELKKILRVVRRRETVRIAWRDLAGWASLAEVMSTLSELAEACTDRALDLLYSWAIETDGQPIGNSSKWPVNMVVLAMGKLGGSELNFSSDIDLIFFYGEDGETNGDKSTSNHQFFLRLGQRLISVLNDTTKDGFVFRVDMRLRPNGDSGPLVLSFDAAENYYQTHGREWERYAFIKARVIAGDRQAGNDLSKRLTPFIYRRYLDYGAIESIRFLKTGINQELNRKGIKNNIKIGPGGIREIEFLGQAFQLIRGGREPELRVRSILPVLAHLSETGVLTKNAGKILTEAYIFLRKTENRLQMMADKQTHVLPESDIDRLRLAFSMGFASWSDFEVELRRLMRKVHEDFSQVFVAPQGETDLEAADGVAAVWMDRLDDKDSIETLEEIGFSNDPSAALNLIKGLRQGSSYKTFSKDGRQRMDHLMPLLLAAAGLSTRPETTLSRIIKLLEAIGRRSAYLALMLENPLVLSQLVKLCSASPWIADWITNHPLLLDELLNPVNSYVSHNRDEFIAELDKLLQDTEVDDLERHMEVLREFCNRHVLHVAAADVGPGLPPEQVGNQLSLIAEALIDACLKLALISLEARHGRPSCLQEGSNEIRHPGFMVVAYGKLGSHELGFGSDVDIIFLYESCPNGEGETLGGRTLANETFFARVGQRIIHLLTTRTTGGILYETDMRLRPSGQSGPLVTSLSAFHDYQRKHAWTWEQQALVRARPIAGEPNLISAFAEARRQILCQSRDIKALTKDVVEMRNKMMSSQTATEEGKFDIKHDRGGIVDIEFMVQYWVLRWAHQYPDLTQYTDNAAILEVLAKTGLLPKAQAELLISAYYHYLSTAYRLKLMQDGSSVELEVLAGYPHKIAAIWLETFPVAGYVAGKSA